MRRRSRSVALGVWICLVVGLVIPLGTPAPSFAQVDPGGLLFALINQVRLSEGLAPFGSSVLLTQAAQGHATDLVTLGQVTHEGSDGSGYQQRIREARYNAWNDGLLVDEALWAGLGTAEDALRWFRSNPEWSILIDPRYREAGIGYADDNGVRYFVVDVGSRPGVLPIFINDGAETTESSMIALRLTNEEAVPLGDGTWIGKAIEVRLSNSPDFDGVPWQPWEPLLPWTLSGEVPGDYAVYAELRDGANRTTVAEDVIRLVAPGESPPTATPFLDLLEITPEAPAATPPSGGETPLPTTVLGASEEGPPTLPVSSPTPPARSTQNAGAESGEDTSVFFPTWTPLPTDVPAVDESSGPDWPLVMAILLQGAAIVLGIAAFLRRH